VIAAVLMIEPVVGGWESARLAALLDGRSAGPAAGAMEPGAVELAEIMGLRAGEAKRWARLLAAAAAARVQSQRDLGEALKGAERMIGI